MTAHDVPFLWCILQAALLSTLGVGAAWLFARKAPAAGAAAAAAAAAMIAVVTLLIPAPVPKLQLWQPSRSGDLVDATAPVALDDNVTANDWPSTGGLSIDVEDLAARVLASVGAGGMAEQEFGPLIESCVVGFFALGAAVGILRFMWALSFVARVRRERAPIIDDGALRLFAELKTRMGVVRSVELCEAPRIASPAVIGWRRPIVLLPTERGDWTEEQLRATLAHELAHIVRGDFFWRLLAGATQAIHFFHPLVHLLTRRLTLLQELATDRLAATAAGGSATYLRALSELAIRLDDQSRLRAEPIVLPALSSNLMRRITMLRSKEGSVAERKWSLAGAAAVALITLVGIGGVALRGHAEAIEPTGVGAGRKAELFSRSPLMASILNTTDGGLFVIRPSEIAKQPQFVPMFRLLNKMFLEHMRQLEGVNVAAKPEIRFEAIEYIAGVPKLEMRPKTDNDAQDGRLVVGCEEFVVRFHDEVAWEKWFEKVIPDAEHATEDGFTHFVLPAMPATGAWWGVAVRDGRTLVFATERDRLRELATAEATPPVSSNAWKSLDGGLATLLALGELPESALPEDPAARMAVTIMLKTIEYGAAFDVDPATSQSQVRFVLTSTDLAAAEQVQAAVEGLLPHITTQLRAQINIPSEATAETPGSDKRVQTAGDASTERNVRDYWMTIFESCTTRLEPQADGTVQVRIDAEAVLPQNVLVAYEYEVAKGAAEEESTRQ